MRPGRPTEPLPYLLILVAVFALGVVVGTGFDSEPPAQSTPAATPALVEQSSLAPKLEDDPEPSDAVVYHGNTQSRVFHAPSCYHYDCPNCTAVFASRDEAIRAGYRPGGNCKP